MSLNTFAYVFQHVWLLPVLERRIKVAASVFLAAMFEATLPLVVLFSFTKED